MRNKLKPNMLWKFGSEAVPLARAGGARTKDGQSWTQQEAAVRCASWKVSCATCTEKLGVTSTALLEMYMTMRLLRQWMAELLEGPQRW